MHENRNEESLPMKFPAQALLIAVVIALTYSNSLEVPFVFDDLPCIVDNPSIKNLSKLSEVLSPPPGMGTVEGRPLANLSFAISYAMGGLTVTWYHVANILIHILAALTLYGIVRRTLSLAAIPERLSQKTYGIALFVSLLWGLHPLTTAAVTYIVQRTESLASLLYLLTVYAAIRANEGKQQNLWRAAAFLACLAGMATKEIAVSAPVTVIIYDVIFIDGSLTAALRRRGKLYLLLSSTWLLLASLIIGGQGRSHTVGFNIGVAWGDYLITQAYAVIHYLRLSLWPSGLVFDYGYWLIKDPFEVLPQITLLATLAAATVMALLRNPKLGFSALLIIITLSPTTLVPLKPQIMAEHRMYLPLAGVAVLFALACERISRSWKESSIKTAATILLLALALTTHARNSTYRDLKTLMEDNVAKLPDNERAQGNLGRALLETGDFAGARTALERSAALAPQNSIYAYNLGNVYALTGDCGKGAQAFQRAVELNPSYTEAHINLGNCLAMLGKPHEASASYRRALELSPVDLPTLVNLGRVLLESGRPEEAAEAYSRALTVAPRLNEARAGLALALARATGK